jgi:putative flippase GtrA
MAAKKDFYIVSVIGLTFGLFLLVVLENIRPAFWQLSFKNAVSLIAGFVVFANGALWIGGTIGQRIFFVWQFVKFAAVGSMNAALDLGLINLLSLIFKIYSGWPIVIFNVISVGTAITNSYFLNKFWSFKSRAPIGLRELIKFIAVSLATLTINTAFIYFLTTTVGAPDNISAPLWENIAKLIAVPFTLILNFMGYKFLVFGAVDKSHSS